MRRTAILLVGGHKTGDDRFYEQMVPRADRRYATYLDELESEGLIVMPNTKKWSESDSLARAKPGVLETSDANRAKRAALRGEIRRARQMTQETLAETLGMTQSEVSKVEHRTDVYVSTLRRYIEAMGGELEIIARFPNGNVEIIQISRAHAEWARTRLTQQRRMANAVIPKIHFHEEMV